MRQWVRGHKPAVAAAGSVLVAGIVVLGIVIGSVQGPAASTPSPSLTAGSSAPPTHEGDTGWAALDLAPYEPVAELIPARVGAAGVAPQSDFTFRSLTSTPALELAASLAVYPPTELVVSEGATPDEAVVRPATALAANARYHFELSGPDGALVAEWHFRTGGPLHVVNTLPGDEATQVPLDTGIEIEFDQDGVGALEQHLTIEPTTPGRLEGHGRTWAFVPSSDLRPATLYTVTVAPGVRIDGSDSVLDETVSFRFETAAESEPREPMVFFGAAVREALPGEAPVLMVDVFDPDDEASELSREVDVFELPTVARAAEALSTLRADLDWATASSSGAVPTAGLERLATVTATISMEGPAQMRLPVELEAGWYLLNLSQEGRDAQLVLQVSDLAVYALASDTRTVVWVNDLRRGGSIVGAAVSVLGGGSLGTTDASGLVDVATPGEMRDAADGDDAPAVLVAAPDGRSLIAPLGNEAGGFRDAARSQWWLVLGTDRTQYRTDDTVNAWGVIRARADRAAPPSAELRLVAGYDADGPALDLARVSPTARGTFAAELTISDLPLGPYVVALFVEGELVAETNVSVADIRKPAFRIELQTDRRVYLHGDTGQAQARATFYDGTAAPGMRLLMAGNGAANQPDQVVTADGSGTATLRFRTSAPDGSPEHGSVDAMPEQPEEGGSNGSASIVVLPSTAWLVAEASLEGGTLAIRGTVASVDLQLAERQMSTGWIEDPSGEPLAGRRVSVEVERRTWVSRQVGTAYDFLLKRRVPRYEYDEQVDQVGSFAATSGPDGTFLLSIPDLPRDGWYNVELRVNDADGRAMRVHTGAASSVGSDIPRARPYLESPSSCSYYYTPVRSAALAEDVTLTLREGDGSTSPPARTLYLAGRLGLQQALVTDASTYTHAMDEADLPSFTVRAVRILPAGMMVTNDMGVRLADGEKAIEVTIRPDRAAYAPGANASVAVTTIGPDGRPLAADVIVRVMDMKLYAVGAAQPLDTGGLMASVPSGFVSSYTSHRVPDSPDDGCGGGATSGGGDEPREDFQDLADFQMIQTDGAGRGRASFTLPDDITSWEVAAAAFGDDLEAGVGSVELPTGLDFFVDSVIAPTYLAGEQPVLQLRGYGDALGAGDRVRFTVTGSSLGLPATTVEAPAFQVAGLELPALPLGEHRLTIVGQVAGSDEQRDEVVRTFRVLPTRLRTVRSSFDVLSDDLALPGGDGLTTYVVTDAGRGGLLAALQALASGSSARLDASLAAEEARGILASEFELDPATLPPSGFNVERMDSYGLSLFPYAQRDLFLTARVALLGSAISGRGQMSSALREWADDPSTNRERRTVALAGLAGLGEDVGSELRAQAVEELTVRERLWLGLGLAAVGDEEAARDIERSILAEHGRRLGDWVRLEAASAADSYEATALGMLLAAQLRDPIALDLSRYLLANPSNERLAAVEQLGFVQAALRWLPRQEARFAWSIGAERHEESLEAGGSFRLVVTAAQRTELTMRPLDGQVMVASTWDGDADYDALPNDPLVSITRTVQPSDAMPAGQVAHVRLQVDIEPGAPKGCYEVTDILPSGLAPIVATWTIYADDSEDFIRPYAVEGQRVSWCVDPSAPKRPLGYTARVVTPGTYRWEPALVQSMQEPNIGSATGAGSYTIR